MSKNILIKVIKIESIEIEITLESNKSNKFLFMSFAKNLRIFWRDLGENIT